MHETSELNHKDLDDQLAEFTDQLLAMEAGQEPNIHAQDPELVELQETVILLREAIGGKLPEKQTANRIRANLIVQWNILGLGKEDRQKDSWIEKLRQRFRAIPPPKPRNAALSLVAAAIILAIFVVLLTPELDGDLVGTSGMAELPTWAPIVAVLVLLILALVWWFIRSRKQ